MCTLSEQVLLFLLIGTAFDITSDEDIASSGTSCDFVSSDYPNEINGEDDVSTTSASGIVISHFSHQ